MLNEITDNAVTEEVVALQEPEVTESTESVESEVATDTVEEATEVQSAEENTKFKELRLKYERETQSAIDKEYSQMYGEQYGIHTKADYEKAMAKQKETELLEQLSNGEVDPEEAYRRLKENDPDFQNLKKMQQETSMKNEVEQLNKELKELDVDITIESLDDVVKLKNVDDIVKYIENGKTLSEAYFLANKKEIIDKRAERVQTETLAKVASLEGASPGSLNNPGEEKSSSIYSLSNDDFKKMQEDVLMGRRK